MNGDHDICSNPELCNNCIYKDRCYMMGCASASYDLYQNCYIKNAAECYYQQTIMNTVITLTENLLIPSNKNIKLFKDYIYNYFKKNYREI